MDATEGAVGRDAPGLIHHPHRRRIQLLIKVVLDRIIAGLALVAVAPLGVVIAALIRLDSRGPIFFRQERVGRGGEMFRIWKFRTMVPGAERVGVGYLVEEDDARITRVGRLLRRWSLDEVPQLLNVLRGEMSLVGPRPTLRYQVEQYDARQRRRLNTKPGITGWAQVNGRNALSWPERIELDVWYVEHWSLWLDLKILARTLRAVLSGDTIYADDLSKLEVRARD